MRSAVRAFDILELLARHPAALPAPVIARMLEIPRSTTYELLTTLQGRGLVCVDDDGRWTTGEQLQTLAGSPPSLSEAIAVLDAFERGSERVDAVTVARRTGVDAARVGRLLSLLEAESLVTGEDGTFGLGARLALLVSKFRPLEELRLAARPALADLHRRSRETANLLVADGDAAIYIDQAEDSGGQPLSGWTGRRIPLAGSACGRALADPSRPHTVSEAVEPGIAAVACAVRSSSACPAVISVIAPSSRMRGAHLAATEQLVVSAGEAVSERLASLSRNAARESS
jgi:IclR family transcriptional regulator, acetate operon repressor